jgi:hypothetical protein
MTDDQQPDPQAVPLVVDPRERRLLADLEASGRLGTPHTLHSMPFTNAPEDLSRAIVTGAPRFATRRRRIEVGVDTLLRNAEQEWLALADRHRRRPERFADAWRHWVAEVDAAQLNRLIRANEYYPIEARLRMDLYTGAYITFDGQDYRYPLVTETWLLDRFPADLDAALIARQASA